MINKTSKTPVAPIVKFRQLDEAFDWAIKGDGVEEQVHRLKVLAKSNQTVIPVFRIGVGAEKHDWGIPEGIPDVAKIKPNPIDTQLHWLQRGRYENRLYKPVMLKETLFLYTDLQNKILSRKITNEMIQRYSFV